MTHREPGAAGAGEGSLSLECGAVRGSGKEAGRLCLFKGKREQGNQRSIAT